MTSFIAIAIVLLLAATFSDGCFRYLAQVHNGRRCPEVMTLAPPLVVIQRAPHSRRVLRLCRLVLCCHLCCHLHCRRRMPRLSWTFRTFLAFRAFRDFRAFAARLAAFSALRTRGHVISSMWPRNRGWYRMRIGAAASWAHRSYKCTLLQSRTSRNVSRSRRKPVSKSLHSRRSSSSSMAMRTHRDVISVSSHASNKSTIVSCPWETAHSSGVSGRVGKCGGMTRNAGSMTWSGSSQESPPGHGSCHISSCIVVVTWTPLTATAAGSSWSRRTAKTDRIRRRKYVVPSAVPNGTGRSISSADAPTKAWTRSTSAWTVGTPVNKA